MLLRSSIATLALVFLILPAQARHLHHYRHILPHHQRMIPDSTCHGTTYDNDGRTHCAGGFPSFSPSPLEGRGGVGPRGYIRERRSRNNESRASLRGGQDPSGLVTISTAANPITVASSAAERFKTLIADLVARGFRGHVDCYAAHGHIPSSLHHIGEACDFAQTGWDRTVAIMYRSTDLIASHGLRDGCTFRGRRDCGHVDTGRAIYARARRARYRRFALRR